MTEIPLYGDIGEGGIDAEMFRDDVRAATPPVTLRVHSYGGDPLHALAMFNIIKGAGKPVEGVIDGIAASAATLPLMACNPVVMPSNAFMMLHNPALGIFGDAQDLAAGAGALKAIQATMVQIYASKASASLTELESIMAAESWLGSKDCLRLGLCDRVVDAVPMAAMGYKGPRKLPAEVAAAMSLDYDPRPEEMRRYMLGLPHDELTAWLALPVVAQIHKWRAALTPSQRARDSFANMTLEQWKQRSERGKALH